MLLNGAIPETIRWLPLAQQGDPDALRQFYDTYQPAVTRLCRRLLQPGEAEDAVQATFVNAFRMLPRFRGESALKTWVYRIAYNVCIDTLRRRRAQSALDERIPAADRIAQQTDQVAVQQAMAHLHPDQRALLALYYWEEVGCEEIAAILRISVSAVKMRLFRARNEFRRYYEG